MRFAGPKILQRLSFYTRSIEVGASGASDHLVDYWGDHLASCVDAADGFLYVGAAAVGRSVFAATQKAMGTEFLCSFPAASLCMNLKSRT